MTAEYAILCMATVLQATGAFVLEMTNHDQCGISTVDHATTNFPLGFSTFIPHLFSGLRMNPLNSQNLHVSFWPDPIFLS